LSWGLLERENIVGHCVDQVSSPQPRCWPTPLAIKSLMNCQQLAQRISVLQPDLPQIEIARLCLLILSHTDAGELFDDESLLKAWQDASFRLEAAIDQHAAVTEELDKMCGDDPVRFTSDQLWTLLRTIKVQSQVLELYAPRGTCANS
jgi:hypothetical protein